MSGESEVRLDMAIWRESSSVVFDLDVSSVLLSETRVLLSAPLTPEVASHGVASLGMQVSLLDIAAAEPAMVACRPDWTATQDLSLHGTHGWLTRGPVVVDAQLVRAGKKNLTVAANIYDGCGVDDFALLQRAIDGDATACAPILAARGLVTFVRLPRSAASSSMASYDPWSWIGQVRRRTYERPPVGTLRQRMGAQVLDAEAGVVELERTRYVSNAIGTIFGGAQAALLQFAAEAMRPQLTATDLQLHYLAQVRVGPVRTRGTISRDDADHSVVTVELRDVGHRDQLLALATITLRRAPG